MQAEEGIASWSTTSYALAVQEERYELIYSC